MDPKIWGPSGWMFLHSITFAYPTCPNNNDKKNMIQFITSLQYVLPCSKCSENFKKHLKIHPITDEILSSKDKLIKWMIDMHNEVNKITGEKQFTYDQVIKIYSNKYNNSNSNKNWIIFLVIICIFFIIIFIIYFYKKWKST
ncbi:Erv1/Alr family sulfhydryl oxidase [uncultured virus]|nr:Erv1/Alr family sulfhydryl oxidase [uncultured virus]